MASRRRLGLAHPLGLVLAAEVPGLEHAVEGLLRLLQQAHRPPARCSRAACGISLVDRLAQRLERLERLGDRVIGVASVLVEPESLLAMTGHLLAQSLARPTISCGRPR